MVRVMYQFVIKRPVEKFDVNYLLEIAIPNRENSFDLTIANSNTGKSIDLWLLENEKKSSFKG